MRMKPITEFLTLAFNIVNSSSFKELLNYYNKANPILNQQKLRTVLSTTLNNYLNLFFLNLRKHIENNG
jgi:hypothetical protein